MRAIGIVVCVGLALLLATASSRGDGEPPQPPEEEPAETMPLPGSETPMKPPFTAYSYGPPEARWDRADMSPAEQVVADRGLDSDYSAVHGGYMSAIEQRSAKARADAAARRLGIDTLETGVVP
jgi:hypothetical protein